MRDEFLSASELCSLFDAKSMLFVYYQEADAAEFYPFLEEGVGADDDWKLEIGGWGLDFM